MILFLLLLGTNSATRNQATAWLALPILERCLDIALFTDEVVSVQLAFLAIGKCRTTVLTSVTGRIDSVPICTLGARYRSRRLVVGTCWAEIYLWRAGGASVVEVVADFARLADVCVRWAGFAVWVAAAEQQGKQEGCYYQGLIFNHIYVIYHLVDCLKKIKDPHNLLIFDFMRFRGPTLLKT